MLTIAYITNRIEPKFDWFLDSLSRELHVNSLEARIVVVDFHREQRDKNHLDSIKSVTPKPCVWQGPHRLTKEDWFAAANARNTALCLAPDGWIAYVDDISVLLPDWLQSVREAMDGNYIVCGAYKKVKNLVVERGLIKSFEPFSEDCRLKHVTQDVTPCAGNWLYGCSLAAPVEALLTVGGWPEYCDGLGSEDYCLGLVLANAGFQLKYDRRMMTYESEEEHYQDKPFRRTDKGVSPMDKSHAALNLALQSKYFPNYYEGGIRKMREEVLSGQPFPIVQAPQNDWYDGQLICDMT